MKFCGILFVIFKLILDLGQCHASTWECDYKDQFPWLDIGTPSPENSGYRCFLKSNDKSPTEVTAIEGHHKGGMSDDYVSDISIQNSLKKLSSTLCQKFRNIKTISISNKKIELIEADALADCEKLEIIVLENNGLNKLPENLFHENKQLTNVWINGNDLSQPLPENFFQNLNQVYKIILSENKINFLPPKIFHPLVELLILELSKNELTAINPEWFENLGNLKYLFLSANRITELPTGVLKPLVNLEQLDLGRNFIEHLSPDSFRDSPKLTTFRLEENFISELPCGIFANLNSLKELQFGSNQLQTLHSDSFGSHLNLTTIHVERNMINAIDENILDKMAVSDVNMWMNLCFNDSIWTNQKSKIKEKLKKCFENYEPRQSNACGSSRTTESKATESN